MLCVCVCVCVPLLASRYCRVHALDNYAEELVTGLSRVSWDKVDVSFHKSRRKFAAHSVIQVPLSFSPDYKYLTT